MRSRAFQPRLAGPTAARLSERVGQRPRGQSGAPNLVRASGASDYAPARSLPHRLVSVAASNPARRAASTGAGQNRTADRLGHCGAP